jgi:hypothetical protein
MPILHAIENGETDYRYYNKLYRIGYYKSNRPAKFEIIFPNTLGNIQKIDFNFKVDSLCDFNKVNLQWALSSYDDTKGELYTKTNDRTKINDEGKIADGIVTVDSTGGSAISFSLSSEEIINKINKEKKYYLYLWGSSSNKGYIDPGYINEHSIII